MILGWKFTDNNYTSFRSYRGEKVVWSIGKINRWTDEAYVQITWCGLHAAKYLGIALKHVPIEQWTLPLPRLLRVAAYSKASPAKTPRYERRFDETPNIFCSYKMQPLAEINYHSALRSTMMIFGLQWSDIGDTLWDELNEDEFRAELSANILESYKIQHPELYALELKHNTL